MPKTKKGVTFNEQSQYPKHKKAKRPTIQGHFEIIRKIADGKETLAPPRKDKQRKYRRLEVTPQDFAAMRVGRYKRG